MTEARKTDANKGFLALFIRRPVLASVVSLLIVIAGAAALLGVEVRELPEVDQPVVTVEVEYRGATPETIDAEVTAIVEQAVAQVDGVVSISSSSRFAEGRVTIEFSPRVDIDIAATDVQNAVSAIRDELPEGIEEPEVVKADADGSPMMRIGIFAPGMEEGALGDLIDKTIAPRLEAVEGVASVDTFGVRKRTIRVRLNPVALAARGLGVDDIVDLVSNARVSAPSGTLKTGAQEILIRAEAPATTPEHIGALRVGPDTLLSDIAVVEWGVERESRLARYDGQPAAGLGILRQAQSNTVAVSRGVRQAIDELKRILPPNVEMIVAVDDSVYIERAVEEVAMTLGVAVLIVVAVIFVFLGRARATLIPTLAIPISLIGTIAAMWLAGFSINILSLLALVMATGLVVDDSIVVTENIERWRAKGLGPRAAAIVGSREIVFAVLATTATLIAVFVPISFMPGQAGRLFSEFGFVMAFAVAISSVVALTLCPMLTVKLAPRSERANAAVAAMGRFGRKAAGLYERLLNVALRRPLLAFFAAIGFAASAVGAYALVPKELTPDEDRGRVFAMVGVQQSANVDYLRAKLTELERRLQPLVARGDAEGIVSVSGIGGSNRAFVIVSLPEWGQRKKSQQEIEAEIRPILSSVPGLDVQMRRSNSLGIRGAGQGLRFAVAGDDYEAAAKVAEQMSARLEESPTFSRAELDFETSQPQLNVNIDREAAARLGVNPTDVATIVNAYADEYKAAELFIGDRVVDVLLSAGGEPIDDPTDLQNLFVRTSSGTFVPLSLVASVEEVAVAANLSREERRRAVPVTASLGEGASLGEAIAEMRAAADGILPDNMSVILLGEARLLEQATESAWIVFAFAALIVLLVLAAQFESFVSAFVITATVPFGLAAAVYAMLLTGGSFNYYSQIGLVLLIGVMAKNGILIVEFANQLRDRGLKPREAVMEASLTRLRPVLMTALSTVLGGLPLILGSGAGAEARAALGWVVVGGLGFATLFTLFLTPAAYLLLARFSGVRAREAQLLEQELAEAAAPKLKASE